MKIQKTKELVSFSFIYVHHHLKVTLTYCVCVVCFLYNFISTWELMQKPSPMFITTQKDYYKDNGYNKVFTTIRLVNSNFNIPVTVSNHSWPYWVFTPVIFLSTCFCICMLVTWFHKSWLSGPAFVGAPRSSLLNTPTASLQQVSWI